MTLMPGALPGHQRVPLAVSVAHLLLVVLNRELHCIVLQEPNDDASPCVELSN